MIYIQSLPFGATTCAIVPGRARDPEGFVDTLNELAGVEPHVYLSAAGVFEAAKRFGWTVLKPDDVEDLALQVRELEGQVEQLERELQDYDRRFQAIDVLESADFTARKKAGRPKKVAA